MASMIGSSVEGVSAKEAREIGRSERSGRVKAILATAAIGLGIALGSLAGAMDAGAAPKDGGRAGAATHCACWCDDMITTADLNFRTVPGVGYDVIEVIPNGTAVTVSLAPEHRANGFAKVRCHETWGYASSTYLNEPDDNEGYPLVGVRATMDDVNFRRGPGFDYYVQEVIPTGAQVAISNEVINDFRYVEYGGEDGWVYDALLDHSQGGPGQQSMTATTDLNLRGGGTLNSQVLVVIPEGGVVYASDVVVNGFRSVVYGSYEGWAYVAYLA